MRLRVAALKGHIAMAQETTEAFGKRFTQAVEGHPLGPPTAHGRQRWVLDKLKRETGLEVSANTMSKWFHGQAMPRGDNLRALARVLGVDEVWLALGHRPVVTAAAAGLSAANARGASLMLAGLIEMNGGRVIFPGDPDSPVDLSINAGGVSFDAVVVSPRISQGEWSFIIPEPVGDARILSVTTSDCAETGTSVGIRILDITECRRQRFGGYSVVVLETRKNGKFKRPDCARLLAPVGALWDIVPA